MIYLIEVPRVLYDSSGNPGPLYFVLKLGYSGDLPTRLYSYKSVFFNSMYVVGTHPFGDQIDEKALHYHLRDTLKEGAEWFDSLQSTKDWFLGLTEEKLKVYREEYLASDLYKERVLAVYGKSSILERYDQYRDLPFIPEQDKILFSIPGIRPYLDGTKGEDEFKNTLIEYLGMSFAERFKFLYYLDPMMRTTISLFVVDTPISLMIKAGPERCKALGFNVTDIRKYVITQSLIDKDQLKDKILLEFRVGERDTKVNIKERLRQVYSSIGYSAAPKATELGRWFEIRNAKVLMPDGKRVPGFEIIKAL